MSLVTHCNKLVHIFDAESNISGSVLSTSVCLLLGNFGEEWHFKCSLACVMRFPFLGAWSLKVMSVNSKTAV